MLKGAATSIFKGVQRVNKKSAFLPLANSNLILDRSLDSQKRFTSRGGGQAAPSGPSFAVIMSGCGFLDGTEVTEAVSILIHLSERGYSAVFFAPEGEQAETIDHNTREVEKNEVRTMIAESSRITRQRTLPLAQLKARNFEGLILPGGFGVAKNLSNYATEPTDFTVHPDVAAAIKDFYDEKKPIAAACIAPILVGKVLGKNAGGPGCSLTLGGDAPVEEFVRNMGNEIATPSTKVTEAHFDEANRIITSPAYMSKVATPHQVYQGLGEMIDKLTKSSGAKSAVGGGKTEKDWEFYDYLALRVMKYTKEEWALLKKDILDREESKKKQEK